MWKAGIVRSFLSASPTSAGKYVQCANEVSNNPLVPAGRELLYAKAFYAGFTDDLQKAIPILVHQVEHSVSQSQLGWMATLIRL